ncbi:MFS polyamine transporter [Boletus edulis BED1]|uniref:MFS polyamine transporter n=1 Tax=Boletus edulis BED1 TaxID=1328754 RepID=A0AAD4G905_BOLED|nr:MFS polyamine transporter [Boletus edulis BED1]
MSTMTDSCLRTANTAEEHGTSPTATLHHDNHPPDASRYVAQDMSTHPNPNEKADVGEHTNILVVDWDSPDDPRIQKSSWSFRRKWAATAIVSGFTFITPVSSSMVAPATGQLAAEFGIHSSAIIAFTTSIFVLAFGNEIYGRSRVLQLANLWYLVWNLVCGFAQNEPQLLGFRFLAGLGGSAPLAIGGGVLGDCWHPEERGKAIALYSLAPLLGPVIGPTAGAWIAERSTWRWVFWSTSIVDAAIQVLGLFFLQETYAPLLLERKAKTIRLSMDVEKAPHKAVRTIFDGKQDHSWSAIMTKSLVRPFTLFAQEPIIQLLGVYMAYLYGLLYLFLTTIPSIFEGVYEQPVGIAGLHYIALGVGLTGASQLNAGTMDKIYVHLKSKNGGVGKPEFRLPSMFVGTVLLPIGLLITGWTVEAHAHWIAPDIGIALVGAGVILNFQSIIYCLLVFVGTALAAVAFLRSLAGCGFPLFAPAMYSALGYGKGDTVLAAVAIVIGCPAPWVFWRFGERIRNASRHAR